MRAFKSHSAARSPEGLGKMLVLSIMALSALNCGPASSEEGIQSRSCGELQLVMHSDGTYEYAYAWTLDGCQEPDYGSFAERFEGSAQVVSVVIDVAQLMAYFPIGDVYVWGGTSGSPGEVLALLPQQLFTCAWWPEVYRNVFPLEQALCVDGFWWTGFWGDWPMQGEAEFYVGADLNGPGGGRPMTKIAPGLEWPEGWQDVSVRWGPTSALGIGAEVVETPSPAISPTWGAIKSLFR